MVTCKNKNRLELEDEKFLIELSLDGKIIITFKDELSCEQQNALKVRLNTLIPTKRRWEVNKTIAQTSCSFYEQKLLTEEHEKKRLIKAVSEI